jgi:hypothetical protein
MKIHKRSKVRINPLCERYKELPNQGALRLTLPAPDQIRDNVMLAEREQIV